MEVEASEVSERESSLDNEKTEENEQSIGTNSNELEENCPHDSPAPDETDAQVPDEISQECEVNSDSGMGQKIPPYLFDNFIHITSAWKDFSDNDGISHFNKGCKWAPDGTCILSNSDDNVLRVFDLPQELHCQECWDSDRTLPEIKSVLRIQEGRTVYDYCWYPLMSSWNPLSCCLVSTSQFSPVHLWDAFTGELRCTYSIFNHLDELEPAVSVAFDPSGERLYAGSNSKVCVFRTGLPGRTCEVRSLKDTSHYTEKQYGLIGCITINPAMSSIYAVGSYAKSIGLYCEPDGAMLCLLQGHTGGVTHMEFSPDGTKLYSGGRKDPEILCWDMRYPGNVLFSAQRAVHTNQRVYFNQTADGRFLASGTTGGSVLVWDTNETPETTSGDPVLRPRKMFQAHKDAVTGVSLHQQYPILATSSGQRHFPEPACDSDDDTSDGCQAPLLNRKCISRENCLKFWWVGKESSAV